MPLQKTKMAKRVFIYHLLLTTALLFLTGHTAAQTTPSDSIVMHRLKDMGAPLTYNNRVELLMSGDEKFTDLFEAIRGARHHVHLEYFNFRNDSIAGALFRLLAQKVKEGVEVRALFDAFGNLSNNKPLTKKHLKAIREQGIEIVKFDPFTFPWFNHAAHRDHRKIVVIDGRIAYTGGVNLADEYINAEQRFGYWKDSGVRLEGEGAWGLTASFIHMCINIGGVMHNEHDYYRPHTPVRSEGFCQPFTDGPQNNPDNPAEDVFLQMISNARRFLYITTPYFIPDESVMRTLCIAGDGGVDVRLMLPGKPDHWYADWVAESYFGNLLAHGVKIYRYTPGFLHAKSIMVDREAAFVGSVNMDYRSFELHCECGVMVYGAPMIESLLEDMDAIVDQSHLVTAEEWAKRSVVRRVLEPLLRLFAIWM